jgi:hypothetical protein
MVPTATLLPSVDWTRFEVEDSDLESIYNLLMEREKPLTSSEMVIALLEERLKRLEREASRAPAPDQASYRPAGEFSVGQTLVFPALGHLAGRVVGRREGENPELGKFDVIQVEFEPGGSRREFAAALRDHPLNATEARAPEEAEPPTPQGILEKHGRLMEAKLVERLGRTEDIVRIAGRWFPRALLAEINPGHLNLAEAVLDVGGGGPLPTKALLEHVELPPSVDPLLADFSLDYALQEDDRFDEVGPAGQVLWFLRRLEPPEVLYPPPRLAFSEAPHDRSVLTADLLRLERELDDEFSPLEPQPPPQEEVVLSLLFPHWRVGTLPLSAGLRPLFPTAYEAPRIRFILVDGHSGEKFPGWVVRNERYVFGLEALYRKYDVPAGGLIRVRGGDAPGEVVVEVVDRHRRNDWIRTISILEGTQIGFTMLKQPVGTSYDDRMIVGLLDPVALDEAWLRGDQRRAPLEKLVGFVFRELAKLNPQSAVHAQALYSGVNVIRRATPAAIFSELIIRPQYSHVGDLYWRLNETAGSGLA